MSDCLFCKIAAGQIPSRKVYEDEELIAFHDIHPWAPVHILIVPKQHIESHAELSEAHAALAGRMMVLAPRLMRELGVSGGFRTLINTGRDGGQARLGRRRTTTSTLAISMPSGGSGRLTTCTGPVAMSNTLFSPSMKKWWWSDVLVSK